MAAQDKVGGHQFEEIYIDEATEIGFDIEMVTLPGATGPIPERLLPTDPPITVNIPVVEVRGRKYSRNQIARTTGIGLSHVSKIFKGTRRPSLDNAVKLAAFFGVSTEELLTKILPRKVARVRKR